MCWVCQKHVINDYDIRESDLPNLPYKTVKQMCVVPGCKNGCILRDYGIAPVYFWPVKIKYFLKRKRFRGGWLDATVHGYTCSRHNKNLMSIRQHLNISEQDRLGKIIPK